MHRLRLHRGLVATLTGFGLDKAAAFATLTSVVALIIGPITAILVASHFTPVLQGYYFTFGSLTSVQFLIELGLGQAVIQFASHEWVNLGFDAKRQIMGDADSLSRLISLGRLTFKWYGLAAVIMLAILIPGGYLFFSSSSTPGVNWMWPWFALCFGMATNLLLLPMFFILQGCNQVAQYWFYRFVQQLVNGAVLWTAILAGARLWTLPLAVACGIVWSLVFLSRYMQLFKTFSSPPSGPRIAWRREVWPVQWRIAVTWFTGTFTSQLFTPVLFKFSGPVVAGQMGLTNTLVNVLIALSSNFVLTKGPRFGMLVAQRRYEELDRTFVRSAMTSMFVSSVGAISVSVLIYVFYYFGYSLTHRILPPLPATLFLLAGVISSVLISLSTYLRAHKKEPLVGVFVSASLIVIVLTLLLGSRAGALGIALGYLGVLLMYQLPASITIFQRCRRQWHSVLLVSEESAS